VGVAFALALGISNHRSGRSEIAACVPRGCFDSKTASGLKEIVEPFIRGTRFEGKFNTTGEPRQAFLNVYVARLGLPGRLASISCNCAYVGDSIIVCDQKFLSTFESTVNFTINSFYGRDVKTIWEQQKNIIEQVNRRIAHVMESWILGHEVGHAILHGDTSLDHRRAYSERQELEADRYFIEKALSDADVQQRQTLSFGLSQFIFAVMGIAFNETSKVTHHEEGKAIIAPSVDGIHPPWLIRALNLGERMDDDVQSDFYKRLASNVLIKPGGIDIGSLCAFENLRELEAHLQEQRLGTPVK
jgi:hypothetical protein